jgi:hypothetical protein
MLPRHDVLGGDLIKKWSKERIVTRKRAIFTEIIIKVAEYVRKIFFDLH